MSRSSSSFQGRILFWLSIGVLVASCTKPTPSFNHLGNAASPYLREHADNPVHWYEWGDEALNRAKDENKPIIISIGYASCHWCHVMEEESFMDSAVAAIMNERFVAIKVDRETRPDIDQVYVNASNIIIGNAGWPLNAFALPNGEPFHVTTYVPQKQWIETLNKVADAFQNERSVVEERAGKVRASIAIDPLFKVPDEGRPFTARSVAEQIGLWMPEFDEVNGGLKGAPKFPLPVIGEMLLQNYYLTGDQQSLSLVLNQLNAMANGAINDQLWGGFARYSVDENWDTPHFEKMLYDNAQLISLYAHAYQVTKNKRYLDVMNRTIHFVNSELSEDFLYHSAINADSEGEEGKYYKWSIAEIESILTPDETALVIEYFGLNPEDKNTASTLSIRYAKPNAERSDKLEKIRKKLLNVRLSRKYPGGIESIITAWNGMMICALLEAAKADNDMNHMVRALACAEALEAKMIRPGDKALIRNQFEGKAGNNGFLEDYAWTAKAFLSMYESSFNIQWLERATQLTEQALLLFDNPESEFLYFSTQENNNPVGRATEIFDSVLPSSNTVMAEVLFHVGTLTGRAEWIERAKLMTAKALAADPGQGIYLAGWAKLAGIIASDPFEVAITGRESGAVVKQLQTKYLPDVTFLGGPIENLPLLENKLVDGKTIIYVCRNKVCKLPTEDVNKALELLKSK